MLAPLCDVKLKGKVLLCLGSHLDVFEVLLLGLEATVSHYILWKELGKISSLVPALEK